MKDADHIDCEGRGLQPVVGVVTPQRVPPDDSFWLPDR